MSNVAVEEWFLSASERGNPATRLDRRHGDGWRGRPATTCSRWCTGRPTSRCCCGACGRCGPVICCCSPTGAVIPTSCLDGPGTEVSRVLSDAAARGVIVKGLVWRSHLDRFAFSEQENRHLGEEIEAAGGECLLDQRVRPGGSHHQKFVVLRHPGRPELDVAFVGGIDLCHSRHDGPEHAGDPQRQPMAKVYGSRPPWHDIQLAVRGPAVGDVETVFRERWEDPAPLTRNPIDRVSELVRHDDRTPSPLPPPATRPGDQPAARMCSSCGPIPTDGTVTRSRRTVNAASPAPTTRSSPGPTA